MMNNLFDIFNPMNSFNYSLNWITLMMFLLFLPYPLYFVPSHINMYMLILNNFLVKEFKLILNKSTNMNLILFISLFLLIFISNFISLMPYIYCSTANPIMPMILALSLWLTFILLNIINFNKFMAHLIPPKTPMYLSFFMTIIELISIIIRPLTLTIRLTANMIAGHLLLSLINIYANISLKMSIYFLMLQFIMFSLEMAVAMIQAYVFTMLNILYSKN